MDIHDTRPVHASRRMRASPLFGLAAAAIIGVASCTTGVTPTIPAVPTLGIPTQFPDDLASGAGACIDAPTMAIIDQLRASASGTDIRALLLANKDALIDGLADLESSDPATMDWRDALLTALDTGDVDAAATQIQRLVSDEVQLTPC